MCKIHGYFTKEDMKMAYRYMKICSVLLCIREIQITVMRYYYTPIRIAKIKNILTIPRADEDAEQLQLLR